MSTYTIDSIELPNGDVCNIQDDTKLSKDFSGLTEATSVSGTDLLAIDTGSETKKIPITALQPSPLVVSIPTSQWSGSGSDYYITVSASNVTTDSILVPTYDSTSKDYLKGPVWCVPGSGSFTIHTTAIPSDTVSIMVQFPGIMGTAQYQVLADVYSTSQAVAKADIVNNLTSTDATKPLAASLGKMFNTLEGHQITNIGSYFDERADFKSRRAFASVNIYSYIHITTQVPATTQFADIGIGNAEGIFLFVSISGGTGYVVVCRDGKLAPDAALPTGYYYVVGSALAPYT